MSQPVRSVSRNRFALLLVLGALSAFGPLSMDLYLPGMPLVARSLNTSDTLAQLTISACVVGLAVGQLISGPLSDRIGRRIPLFVGIGLFVVASVGCAAAPTITVLVIARALQGLAGAAGIVISRAIVRDLYDGAQAARVFSRLVAVMFVTPVLAPLVGGALLVFVDWRAIFVLLAVIGALLLIAAIFVVPDSLAPENRQSGGGVSYLKQLSRVLADRSFMGYALAGAIGGCSLFTYISMSSLIFQQQYGASVQGFSLIFALNAVGIILASQLNVVLVKRFRMRSILLGAFAICAAGAVGVLVSAALGLGILFVIVPLFVSVATQGLQGPNTAASALTSYTKGAGSAAAVLGGLQYLAGSVVPLVASLGGVNGVVLGITMLGSSAVAVVLLLTLTRPVASSSLR